MENSYLYLEVGTSSIHTITTWTLLLPFSLKSASSREIVGFLQISVSQIAFLCALIHAPRDVQRVYREIGCNQTILRTFSPGSLSV